MIDYPKILHIIFDKLIANNIQPIIIGGYIRDILLNKYFNYPMNSKDIDIELYNINSLKDLEEILKEFGRINTVGKHFAVCKLKVDELELDFSLPRIENKTASGHKGFDIIISPDISYFEAFKRRDFTINAIGYDVINKKFIDLFNGIDDIINKNLKAVDNETFIQDPLRVLRAVVFCARFEFIMNKNLFDICKNMIEQNALNELPKERIFQEITKLLLQANKPSIGLKILDKLNGLDYFVELNNIKINQSKSFLNSMNCLNYIAHDLKQRTNNKLILMLAILCDVIAKYTQYCENIYKHSINNFLITFTNNKMYIKNILPLIQYQFVIEQFLILKHDKEKEKLLLHVAVKTSIEYLFYFCKIKYTIDKKIKKIRELYHLKKMAMKLDIFNSKQTPLINGKELLKFRKIPSKEYKYILNIAYEAQINGKFQTKSEAINWLNDFLV